MEDKIRIYEAWVEEIARKNGGSLPHEYARYHAEMVRNFQHERLIHLIVTIFFTFMAILAVAAATVLSLVTNELIVLLPIYSLSGILIILSLFYVKHYYFLENHVQNLYKFFRT